LFGLIWFDFDGLLIVLIVVLTCSTSLLEIARAYSELLNVGWKPKRVRIHITTE
jgi:hypothetical protein